MLEREIIIKEDSREVVEVIAKELDDERRRKQQKKKAAAAEQACRSIGPVDRRAQRAQDQRAVDRPVDRNTLTVSAQLSVVCGRPAGRPGWMSVDRPVDRQSGLGEILLFRKPGYLRLLFNSKVCDLESTCENRRLELFCIQRGC